MPPDLGVHQDAVEVEDDRLDRTGARAADTLLPSHSVREPTIHSTQNRNGDHVPALVEGTMRVDRRLLGWGLFFILLGGLPLAVQVGLIDQAVVNRWFVLWPLLLVGWGLSLLLRRSRIEWLGGAIAAVTLGLMAGGALATGFA